VVGLFLNYERIKYVIERQDFSDENDDYIYPVIEDNFISNEQNLYILELASKKFNDSVVGTGLFNIVDSEIRNSKTAWLSKSDLVIKEIIMKVCNKYNYPFENAEDLQVVKYEEGNYYKEHHDSFPYYTSDFLFQGGHRVLTTLIYLNDNFEGGETRFVNLKKDIKPHKNTAVIFHSLNSENKKCHPKALHAGLPVKSGTKYVTNIWIREQPFSHDINIFCFDFIFTSTIVCIYSILNSINNII
jgi:prolyl 4-hydroxylase